MNPDRMTELETRVRALEDERSVSRLIASYGPLVDAGAAGEVAALWEPGGVYDIEGMLLAGRDEIAAMVESEGHQTWIERGCAHVVSPPRVTIDGDTATAACHSLMIVHRDGAFRVRRATANHWELRRTEHGWQVVRRTNRILDGREESPSLLLAGVRGENAAPPPTPHGPQGSAGPG